MFVLYWVQIPLVLSCLEPAQCQAGDQILSGQVESCLVGLSSSALAERCQHNQSFYMLVQMRSTMTSITRISCWYCLSVNN